MVFWNFIIGGGLGLLIVDPLTGGMWMLKPDQIEAELTPTASGTRLFDPTSMILARGTSPNSSSFQKSKPENPKPGKEP